MPEKSRVILKLAADLEKHMYNLECGKNAWKEHAKECETALRDAEVDVPSRPYGIRNK